MPSVMISANRLTMLMLWPASSMTPSVAIIATGMPAATQKATRALRKMKSTPTTRISPPNPLRSKRLMRSRIKADRTSNCSTLRPWGRVGSVSCRKRSTMLATSNASALVER